METWNVKALGLAVLGSMRPQADQVLKERAEAIEVKRRDLLLLVGGAAALPPLGAAAQSMPVIGFLFIGDAKRSAYWLNAWQEGMTEAGFVEGRNFSVDYRWGEGDPAKLPGFAADLAARRVAVIVTTTEQALAAAKQATTTIPIVFNYVSDPVGKGFVKSIKHPGSNITGIAGHDEGVVESKLLQLAHEVMPTVSRIGYLVAEQDVAFRRHAIEVVTAAGKNSGLRSFC